MLYIKDGYPEVNEVVLCTVTKIYGNTTFVQLDEYEKEGVLTISEIAPGRIRNLREYVIESKKIVCKVLRVDGKQKRIDVSLRRVSVPVMKDKLEQIKKEEYSDRIYEDVSKELSISKDELFEMTYESIFEEYETVFEALYDIMIDNKKIDMFDSLDAKGKEVLINVINDRIKPEKVTYKSKFHLKSRDKDGVMLIKEAIKSSKDALSYDDMSIIYTAAGEFEIKIIHDDIKSASGLYKKFKESLELESKSRKLEVEIK